MGRHWLYSVFMVKGTLDEHERIDVLQHFQQVADSLLAFLRNAKESIEVCVDSTSVFVVVSFPPYLQGCLDARRRGVAIKIVTEITMENVDYCKQIMKFAEVRHIDGIKGNFGVTETEYIASAILQKEKPATQIIYSNAREVIEQQRYIFRSFWSRAIPAKHRIKQIEEGIEPEFVEVITDGIKAANLMVDFAKSVRKEAQLILSQPKTMEQAGKLGMLDHLIHAANSYGAEIRVISPITNENSELARQIMNQAPNIQILAGPVSTAGLFVQDGERYLKAEDKDPNAAETAEATSRVIYSNSKNGVKSFKSIFETLWKQSELYEQLRIANEKLILHDNMQKEFINIAAHELRTPIQPILVTVELLDLQFSSEQEKTTKEKGEITRDELAILVRNAKRLERLSSNILDIARIESGTLHLTIQEFDLNDVILPLVQDARNEIKNRGKEDVITQYAPSDINIVLKGDKDRLSEVVWNLLDNATKFTEKGAISVVTRKDDNYITITVKDSGSGINSDVLPKLFTKFVTKSEKGTGLGLFISKSIIEAHGGKIWAENNNDGKGATFTFTLPLAA
jgi:two-component system, OmpR family, sensor histidine kinase VicK